MDERIIDVFEEQSRTLAQALRRDLKQASADKAELERLRAELKRLSKPDRDLHEEIWRLEQQHQHDSELARGVDRKMGYLHGQVTRLHKSVLQWEARFAQIFAACDYGAASAEEIGEWQKWRNWIEIEAELLPGLAREYD